jgi:hypothetical protein
MKAFDAIRLYTLEKSGYLVKEVKKTAGRPAELRTYSVQIQHEGKRSCIGLGTANKEHAAILARKLFQDIRANGWEAALRRHKGAPVEKQVDVTIGEYIEAAGVKSLFSPKTLESYASELRKIAGEYGHEVMEMPRFHFSTSSCLKSIAAQAMWYWAKETNASTLSHGQHRSCNRSGRVDRSARLHLDRRRRLGRTIARLCRGRPPQPDARVLRNCWCRSLPKPYYY